MIEDILVMLSDWGDISPEVDLRVDNILSGRTFYAKTDFVTPLSDLAYYLCILRSGACGFAYFNSNIVNDQHLLDIVNRSALRVINETDDYQLKISLIDAVCEEYNRAHNILPKKVISKKGSYQVKADFRSRLITTNIRNGKKVTLVGLVTEFVRDLIKKGCNVTVSDLSPELENKHVFNLPINNKSSQTLNLISDADYAIVTGSSFSTKTIDSILKIAKLHGTKLYFYLETGSNFAPYLMERGAHRVIAEKFPFYDLPGESVFEVYYK